MKTDIKYWEITEVTYVSGHRLGLKFNDGVEQVVDFEPFLRKARNPELTQYRLMKKFKSFQLHHGNLMWGDYEMLFPIADLHRGEI